MPAALWRVAPQTEGYAADEAQYAADATQAEGYDDAHGAAETLPEGWSAELDPDSGYTYYYNHVTGESAWEIPTAAAEPANADGAGEWPVRGQQWRDIAAVGARPARHAELGNRFSW